MTTTEVSTVEAALARFRHELEHLRGEAARGAAAEGFDVNDPQLRRAVCFHAVVKVVDLLHELGWEQEKLSEPFFELQTALEGLSFGRQSPMLLADNPGGRPELATWAQLFRGHVTAVQDSLMRLGFDKADAARIVFKALGADAVEALSGTSRKAPTHKTISKWRDDDRLTDSTSPMREGFDHEMALHDKSGAFASKENAIRDAEAILSCIRKEVLSPTFASQNPQNPPA
jgi:hypothetical protein